MKKQEAKEFADSALSLGVYLGAIAQVGEASKLLYEIYKSEGDFERALEMFEFHMTVRDSMRNEDKMKERIRMEWRYKCEMEIMRLEKERKEQKAAEAMGKKKKKKKKGKARKPE